MQPQQRQRTTSHVVGTSPQRDDAQHSNRTFIPASHSAQGCARGEDGRLCASAPKRNNDICAGEFRLENGYSSICEMVDEHCGKSTHHIRCASGRSKPAHGLHHQCLVKFDTTNEQWTTVDMICSFGNCADCCHPSPMGAPCPVHGRRSRRIFVVPEPGLCQRSPHEDFCERLCNLRSMAHPFRLVQATRRPLCITLDCNCFDRPDCVGITNSARLSCCVMVDPFQVLRASKPILKMDERFNQKTAHHTGLTESDAHERLKSLWTVKWV